MEIIVINLDRCPERWAFVEGQLSGLGLAGKRLSAVDGKAMADEEFERLSARHTRPAHRGAWQRNALACFLSHVRAWEMAAQSNSEFSVIFEDDICLSPDAGSLLRDSSWIPKGADLIRLETTSERVLMGRPLPTPAAGRTLRRLRSTTVYAGAYIVSRQAARRLAENAHRKAEVADFYLYSWRHQGMAREIKLFQVCPAPTVQQDKLGAERLFSSNIQATGYQPRALDVAKRRARSAIAILLGGTRVDYEERAARLQA